MDSFRNIFNTWRQAKEIEDKTPAEQFDPEHKHPEDPYEKYHALYGNSEDSRVVLIGKRIEETVKIKIDIKERLEEKVDKITWILRPFIDENYPKRDWAKFVKEEHATNVLIQTGDSRTDGEIFEELRKAHLIPTVRSTNRWK